VRRRRLQTGLLQRSAVRRHSTSFSGSTTIWPRRVVRQEEAPTLDRCSGHFTGFQCAVVITYKMALTTYKLQGADLSDLPQTRRHVLCGHRVIVHRPDTELTRRAFSVAATCFSDSLPADTRLRNTAAIFKRHKDTSFHSKTIVQHRR